MTWSPQARAAAAAARKSKGGSKKGAKAGWKPPATKAGSGFDPAKAPAMSSGMKAQVARNQAKGGNNLHKAVAKAHSDFPKAKPMTSKPQHQSSVTMTRQIRTNAKYKPIAQAAFAADKHPAAFVKPPITSSHQGASSPVKSSRAAGKRARKAYHGSDIRGR